MWSYTCIVGGFVCKILLLLPCILNWIFFHICVMHRCNLYCNIAFWSIVQQLNIATMFLNIHLLSKHWNGFDQQPIAKLILGHSTLMEEKNNNVNSTTKKNDRSQVVVYELMFCNHILIYFYMFQNQLFSKKHILQTRIFLDTHP